METVFSTSQLRDCVDCLSLCRDCLDCWAWPNHALFGYWNCAQYRDSALADVVAPLSDLSPLAGVEYDHDTFAYDLVG